MSFDTVVAGDINIPPSAAIIGTVPGVEVGSVLAVITVEDIAGNAVNAADGGEKVRVVEADAHAGVEGAADIKKQTPAFTVQLCAVNAGRHIRRCKKILPYIVINGQDISAIRTRLILIED